MHRSVVWIAGLMFVLVPGTAESKSEQSKPAQAPPIRLEKGVFVNACEGPRQEASQPVFRNDAPCARAWVQLNHVAEPHKFRFLYYDPDGNLYASTKPDWAFQPTEGARYQRYAWIEHRMPIAGEQASTMPGDWKIAAWLDGLTIGEATFRIEHLPAAGSASLDAAKDKFVGLQYEEASEQFRNVADAASDPAVKAEAYWWLALSQNALGQQKNAEQTLAQVLSADPTFAVQPEVAKQVGGEQLRTALEDLRGRDYPNLYRKTSDLPKVELSRPEDAPVLGKRQHWYQKWWLYAGAGAVAVGATALLVGGDQTIAGPPTVTLVEDQANSDHDDLGQTGSDMTCEGRIPMRLTIAGGEAPYEVIFTSTVTNGQNAATVRVEGASSAVPFGQEIVVGGITITPADLSQPGSFSVVFGNIDITPTPPRLIALVGVTLSAVVRDFRSSTSFAGATPGSPLPGNIRNALDSGSDERLLQEVSFLVLISNCTQE